MTSNITISIPDDLKDRIKLEDNYSKLISELIRDYYEDKSEEGLNNRLELLEEKKKMQVEIIEREKDKIQEKLIVTKTEREIELEIEEKKKKHSEEFKNNVITNYKLLSGGGEMDELLFEKFKLKWDSAKDGYSLQEFVNEQQLQERIFEGEQNSESREDEEQD